jgi:hypothetical protein
MFKKVLTHIPGFLFLTISPASSDRMVRVISPNCRKYNISISTAMWQKRGQSATHEITAHD